MEDAFFPEYIQEKTHLPFLANCIIVDIVPLSCALKTNPIYLLKTVSCNSLLLSNPFRCPTSIYFWMIVFINNPAGLWIAVTLRSIFQLAFLAAGRKTAGLLQALFWFRGAGGPYLILHPDWKLEWSAIVQTPVASPSLVPSHPVHPPEKLQTVRNRGLQVLILQVGRLLVKWLEWRTHAPADQKWGSFRNLSRSHSVPSSGFPMHVLTVGRFPSTWIFVTHGLDTTLYYVKGSAFSLPTSTILSAPRVSSVMSHPAVGLDVLNAGCITSTEWIL